jgi:outer membrane protein assembly factor BamB
VCVVLLTLAAKEASADWVFERGDERATGVAATPLPAQPRQLWRFPADDSGFEATAVIASGTIYVGDLDGTFYAVKLNDGSLRWKKKFKDSGFLAAAAIVAGRVYVGDFNGVVHCLDATKGEELWTYEARGQVYAGPNVVDGRVLVATEAGELLSLDAASGAQQWRFTIEAPLRCWPLVVDGRVLLAGCDSRLHVVDVHAGKEIEGVDLESQTGATPAVWNDSVFFGTVTGTFYRIRGVEIVWEYRDEKRLQQIFSAAVDQRAVIYSNKDKRVYALKPESGQVKWEFPERTGVECSPVIAGDRVYYGTKRGQLRALNVDGGEEVWSFEAGGGFVASPAVSDSRLVIGNTDGTLYCFGEKD